MALLCADLDGVIGNLQQVDPLRASPAAVGRNKDARLCVDDTGCQRVGTESDQTKHS